MLRNAMLSKGNDNVATKVISTENVEKIVDEVRRKNQTYFFSYFYILKILTISVHRIINLNKGSTSSRAIYKCILHVIQNVCHG